MKRALEILQRELKAVETNIILGEGQLETKLTEASNIKIRLAELKANQHEIEKAIASLSPKKKAASKK